MDILRHKNKEIKIDFPVQKFICGPDNSIMFISFGHDQEGTEYLIRWNASDDNKDTFDWNNFVLKRI